MDSGETDTDVGTSDDDGLTGEVFGSDRLRMDHLLTVHETDEAHGGRWSRTRPNSGWKEYTGLATVADAQALFGYRGVYAAGEGTVDGCKCK